MAKWLGAGATFVLGIVVWVLWPAYREEVQYQRQRDKEISAVLENLTKILAEDTRNDSILNKDITTSLNELKVSMKDLADLIRNHHDK